MRLGVLSNQNLEPWVNWTTLGPPLLHPLAASQNARLIAPGRLRLQHIDEWKSVIKEVRSSDTLFWMQGTARPELSVHAASLLRLRVRRSAFVIDAWKQFINKVGILATIQKLDPCFVAFREGRDELRRRFPQGRFEWLPFGVDTTVFDAVSSDRPIFAYWMGRRYEPLHQAMLQYCESRGLDYRYTQQSGIVADPAELGRLVGSSRYFMVTPPNLAAPERTGGFSPFVMRYLEGLSAGARLLGTLPGSGEYQRLLPLDAILQVAPDGSDLAEKLDADLNCSGVDAAVAAATQIVRRQHSWTRRSQQIFERLDNGTPTGFDL